MYFASNLIHDFIEYAALKGVVISPEQNLKQQLGLGNGVNYDTMIKILALINQELNDENLGLHVGEMMSLRATAPVDRIMLNSKTLEDSIQNAIEYSKVISDALECTLNKTNEYYSITYEENPNWYVHQGYARKQILDLALLSNVKSLAAYANHTYYPIRVNFAYKRPKLINEYYRLFNCSIHFNQTVTEIVYDHRILGMHSKEIRLGLLDGLKEKVAAEISHLSFENNFVFELKKCILNHKPKRIQVAEAATYLHVSSRTLQRKLAALNTTFKKVEGGLQIQLAKTYLEENEKSIDEISYLLGFSETSAFIRFFKSSTSQTPKKYKDQRVGD